MEEAKALAQQQLMLQRQQQQQQLLLLQQIQRQKHHQQQQQQQQQQQDAIARFPSNIDVHLRPQHLLHHRPTILNTQQTQPQSQSQLQPQSQPKSHPQQQQQHQLQQSPNPSSNPSPSHPNPNQQNPNSNSQQQPLQQSQSQQQQQQQQQKVNQPPPVSLVKQTELKMAYQDAWTVCHPDFKHPFSSLADACERLLPYHVVADYEAEEEDRILDSDTTGQMQSRSQQWDHNIAAKVAEFTATFEKQVLAFNIISRKRALGEFRSEERLMIEQALLQEERRALIEARAEMDSRQKAGREAHEANLRMAAMVHAEQARAESQSHAEMVARAPIRASALGSQGSSIPMGHDISDQELEVGPDEMINDWGSNAQRDEKEPSDDFLNDDETDNGDTGLQNEWRGGAELDLNTR